MLINEAIMNIHFQKKVLSNFSFLKRSEKRRFYITQKKKFIFTSTTSKQTDFYSSSNSLFSCYDICEELISAFLFNNKIIICRWKMILEEKQTKKWINRGNRIKIEIFFLDWQRNKKNLLKIIKKKNSTISINEIL